MRRTASGLTLLALLLAGGCLSPAHCPGGTHSIDPDATAYRYDLQVLDAVALKQRADAEGRVLLNVSGAMHDFNLTRIGQNRFAGIDGNLTARLTLNGVWVEGTIDAPDGRIWMEHVNGCDPSTRVRTMFYRDADKRPVPGGFGGVEH